MSLGSSESRVAMAALVALMAACTSGRARVAATAGGRSPAAPAGVWFTTDGGDVFAWQQAVGIATRMNCSRVALSVNGAPASASVSGQGRAFQATVPVVSGTNRVVASCTTTGGATRTSAPLVLTGRLTEAPTSRIAVHVSGSVVTLDGSTSEATQPTGDRIAKYSWAADVGNPATLRLRSGKAFTKPVSGTRLALSVPSKDGEYYVSLTVADGHGRSDRSTTYFIVHGGVARVVDMAVEHPSWIDRAVIYAPIPDLTDEGGSKGVEQQLPYLKKLGVDALWLWPPAELRQSGEEYKITDYFKLDPQWGTPQQFKSMVDRAHHLGLHVLIDFVPNHTSNQDPYFLDAQKRGRASHYYDFYDRDANGRVTNYGDIFGDDTLENLNYDNAQVRQMIIEASLYWIRTYGIDGFRVDAAWGVERRRPSFWPEWRAAIKRVKPNVLLFGECTAISAYCSTHSFDAQYDWTDQPGQWAWDSVFDFSQEAGNLLEPAITNSGKGYPPRALPMRFLNNNDTDVKFIDQYGVAMTRVASVLQFTVPGIPEMFAGDEIGASYEPYSTLTPLDWNRDPHHLRPFYEKLIGLKGSLATLRSHEIESLTPSEDSAYAFVRPAFDGGPPVLVMLNFGHKTSVSIPMTAGVRSVVGHGGVKDLLTGSTRTLSVSGSKLSVEMASSTAFVFVPAGAA